MKGVGIGKKDFLFDTLTQGRFEMNVKTFMAFCCEYNIMQKYVKYIYFSYYMLIYINLHFIITLRLFKSETIQTKSQISDVVV